MTTTLIVIAVIVLIVIGVAAYLMRQRSQRNREAAITRADELRTQAATEARSTLPPTQDRAAEAEARAAEVRAQAERAEAEAEQARIAAAQAEAEHESQVREADRLDPRVDHEADDYSPQVAGTVDQQPTPPSEVNTGSSAADPHAAAADDTLSSESADSTDPRTTDSADAGTTAPTLPQRTRGAQEMPGKPIEKTDDGGGWFTRRDSETDRP